MFVLEMRVRGYKSANHMLCGCVFSYEAEPPGIQPVALCCCCRNVLPLTCPQCQGDNSQWSGSQHSDGEATGGAEKAQLDEVGFSVNRGIWDRCERILCSLLSIWDRCERILCSLLSIWDSCERILCSLLSIRDSCERILCSLLYIWDSCERILCSLLSIWDSCERILCSHSSILGQM